MNVLDFSTVNAQVTDEIINVSDANPVTLKHDTFYNKAGKAIVISTGAGGTGTVLVNPLDGASDYTPGGAYTFPEPYNTTLAGDVGYTTIAITNATYHSTDLYVSYYPIWDLIYAARWNNNTKRKITLIGDEDYSPTGLYNWEVILCTPSAAGRTITLPDAALFTGESILVKNVSSGVRNITVASAGGTINGQATIILPPSNNNFIEVYSDGTNWHVSDFKIRASSGWVAAASDWTNRDFAITHNIYAGLDKLSVKFLISENAAADATTFDAGIYSAAGAASGYGITVYQTATNTLNIQTGVNGIWRMNPATGNVEGITVQNWYYNIIVERVAI